ncbi:MAG: hypothetical protein ACKVOO_07530 [Burkholderiaceae bacterium]
MDDVKTEIAAHAARLVVEEGLPYGAAKQRAAKQLGLARPEWPGNEAVEAAVREYIELFCGDTQPAELRTLRQIAVRWMQRLEAFRPHLAGAVWHGTATKLTDIDLHLFCDDSKAAEIALIDHGVRYQPRIQTGFQGKPVDCLSLNQPSTELQCQVGIHLHIYDHDDFRGALKPDAQGRTPRGNMAAVQALLEKAAHDA